MNHDLRNVVTPSGFSAAAWAPARGRQAFHHPRTSLGVAGHWMHLAAVLSPLVIGELISDPTRKWRAIRLSTAAMAVASEALWTHKLLKERSEREKEPQL